jgi:hypothetical protein
VGNLTIAQPPEVRIVCDLACQRAIAANNPLAPTQTKGGSVGIIVQRVVGTRRLLGRTVPRLRFVGRVPFGSRRAGRLRIPWDRRVNGRPLPPGRYLVTFRSLSAGGTVRELARPATLVIRRP